MLTDENGQRADEGLTEVFEQSNLARLMEQVQSRPGIVPFVGAGLSVPFGMPGWRKFLLDRVAGSEHEAKVRGLLDLGNYEEAAESAQQALAPLAFNDAIRDTFGERAITAPLTDEVAIRLLPAIAPGPVVTTNFDQVAEHAFSEAEVPFEQVVHGAQVDPFVGALQLEPVMDFLTARPRQGGRL